MRRLERSGKKAILTKLPSVRGKLRFRRFLRAQEISRARAVYRRVSFFLSFFFKKILRQRQSFTRGEVSEWRLKNLIVSTVVVIAPCMRNFLGATKYGPMTPPTLCPASMPGNGNIFQVRSELFKARV